MSVVLGLLRVTFPCPAAVWHSPAREKCPRKRAVLTCLEAPHLGPDGRAPQNSRSQAGEPLSHLNLHGKVMPDP